MSSIQEVTCSAPPESLLLTLKEQLLKAQSYMEVHEGAQCYILQHVETQLRGGFYYDLGVGSRVLLEE